jgi:hypothetical protein
MHRFGINHIIYYIYYNILLIYFTCKIVYNFNVLYYVTEPNEVADKVLRSAENAIRKRYSIFEMTLQVEPFDESMNSCDQCVCPER